MSRSQQLNLENVKIKLRNFSHIQTHEMLFSYKIIFWKSEWGKAGQGRKGKAMQGKGLTCGINITPAWEDMQVRCKRIYVFQVFTI